MVEERSRTSGMVGLPKQNVVYDTNTSELAFPGYKDFREQFPKAVRDLTSKT